MRAVILALFAVVPAIATAAPKQPEGSAPEQVDDSDMPDSEAESASPPSAHREGDYGGVRPGAPSTGDSRRRSKASKGTLSWIGFEAKDGGADIFLQSAAAFELSQRVENNTLIVSLGGVSRLGKNTWRFIDTRFFDSPISRIVAKRGRGARTEVRITFKSKTDAREATVRTSTEPDGLYYAYLSFSGSPGG